MPAKSQRRSRAAKLSPEDLEFGALLLALVVILLLSLFGVGLV